MMKANTFASRAKILLGPIIGKVTDTTARVLIDLEHDGDIACTVSSDSSRQSCFRSPNKGFPTVFYFDSLKPGTDYKVSIAEANETNPEARSGDTFNEDTEQPLDSGFRTLNPQNKGSLKFGIVSCNEISVGMTKGDADLWIGLAEKAKAKSLDYVFHLGDQCYMDMTIVADELTPYDEAKRELEGLDKSEWHGKSGRVLELLRNHQRKTWRHQPTAALLANIPNLMVLDDHEVRDDWGRREEDYNPETFDYFYGQLARQVYYEYQRQLWDDIDWNNLASLKHDYYAHVLNGIGVVFLDYRGSRSWFREDRVIDTQLGVGQTAWLKELFKKGGRFDKEDVGSVMVLSPLPPIHLSTASTIAASWITDDLMEHWAYKNTKELVGMFEILREWRMRRSGREVMIIGGDVHVGTQSNIYYKGELMFKHLTASAINNVTLVETESAFVANELNCLIKLDENWSYKHVELVTFNNYGEVLVDKNKVVESVLISKAPSK